MSAYEIGRLECGCGISNFIFFDGSYGLIAIPIGESLWRSVVSDFGSSGWVLSRAATAGMGRMEILGAISHARVDGLL